MSCYADTKAAAYILLELCYKIMISYKFQIMKLNFDTFYKDLCNSYFYYIQNDFIKSKPNNFFHASIVIMLIIQKYKPSFFDSAQTYRISGTNLPIYPYKKYFPDTNV
jgi:hypothetical protein